ncbi:SepM family pheromone-processing serine protease [Ectobacillus panaciterrae]|uniref:SepM family pheromone-processing serine protease n=1 Tax=Ectobacillus panaciterrae TaxID=363872 RepID=UPI0003FBA874|nr:SepM family pheromone-processing serine protease [Ectobacillus panaciterrae]
MFKRLRYFTVFIIAIMLAFAVMYVPLPYYITKPGLAEKLEPYVHVDGGYKEKGDFMLVTVSMSRANITNYVIAKLNKYYEIYPEEEILGKGESDEQYQFRQLHLMDASQSAAIFNAYQRANKKVEFENRGVLVVAVSKNMPAAKELKLGDRLTAVDGKQLKTSEEFIDYVKTKKQGDTVRIDYIRNDEKKSTSLSLVPIKGEPDRVGIGVQITTDQKLQVDQKVKIDSHGIGGPSAGMMFTLEIYNQLTKEDITKGYEVAGTGTIDAKGEVGPIGGISQKVIAADKAGADIFFAPNEHNAPHSNYSDAVKTAKDIGTKMKIVPVDTLDDPLNYLEKLPVKK